MPHPLLLALFNDQTSAAAAARAVRQLGVAREDLSIVAVNHQLEGTLAEQVDGTPGSEIEDSRLAGRAGEILASLVSVIGAGVPGTGTLVGAGPLGAELGEVAGHVAGDLSATLVRAGLSESEAETWKTQIHAGAVLLGVHARHVKPQDVESVFLAHGGGRVAVLEWDDNV
jgi:hypothetical protein